MYNHDQYCLQCIHVHEVTKLYRYLLMLYHDVHVHEVTKLSVWYCIIIIVYV